MNDVEKKSKAYLEKFCHIENFKLVNQEEDKITFEVSQVDFITSIFKLEKKLGKYRAYPVDTNPAISQIDAVWTVGKGQHLIYTTQLSDTKAPVFFVSLLNSPKYIPGKIATKIEQINRSYDDLTQTQEWKNWDITTDPQSIINVAKKLGLERK